LVFIGAAGGRDVESRGPALHGRQVRHPGRLRSDLRDAVQSLILGRTLIDVFRGNVSKAMVLRNSVSIGTEQIFSVVGRNWWVQASHAYASRVRAILGGRIIAGPRHQQAQPTPSPSPTVTHSAAPPPAPTTASAAPPTASCYPTTSSGHCYEPGEYCRISDRGTYGVAGDGEKILCEDNNGWRWEPV